MDHAAALDLDNHDRLLAYLSANQYESYKDYFTKHRPAPEFYKSIYKLYPDNHLNWDLTDELGKIFCPEFRAQGHILYYLSTTICSEGHTLALRPTMYDNFKTAMKFRGYHCERLKFEAALDDLIDGKQVRALGQCIWHHNYHHYERSTVDVISGISKLEPIEFMNHEESRGDLTPQQFEILKAVGKSRITIMDGLPGTGKTFTCSNIVNFLEKHDIPVWLLAPTGLAAKNLSDRCARDARTLHSFVMLKDLELSGEVAFLIDEFSMVDIRIFSTFLQTVFQQCNPILILVGDTGQLPSVGPGQVFRELIELRDRYKISYHHLKDIVRQKEGSEIIHNSHNIRYGKTQLLNKGQFLFVEKDEVEASELIIRAATKLKDSGKECSKDFIVLSPTHKKVCGVTHLNERLREIFNPPHIDKQETRRGWREGDKVLVNQNFYQIGLVNGDIGTIKQIQNENQFILQLLDREMKIGKEVIRTLKHAYALTIHKAQGQEFQTVLMPFVNSFFIQLQRKLLYTAVTRAKEKVVIFGNREALDKAITSNREDFRKTGLKILSEN